LRDELKIINKIVGIFYFINMSVSQQGYLSALLNEEAELLTRFSNTLSTPLGSSERTNLILRLKELKDAVEKFWELLNQTNPTDN
jgi:hypothetical protein